MALDQPYYERVDPREGLLDELVVKGWAWGSRRFEPVRRRRLEHFASDVILLGSAISDMSDSKLLDAAASLRVSMVRVGLTRENAVRAFALTREACARQIGLRQYPVQVMGGVAMLGRCIAEMETGEGKTITAALPAVALALAGMPVHVVTVNDYLAERDARQLRPVYEALGLSVGLVAFGQTPEERRDAYAADVAYCTNKDLVFDYLRDRLALGRLRGRPRQVIEALTAGSVQPRVQLLLRGLHAAIVDEADSVLVDEACTPLILAGTACGEEQSSAGPYPEALEMARALRAGSHWRISQREHTVSLTETGRNELRRLAEGRPGLWASRRAREELAERALSALHLFHLDTQYIIADGRIQIVDEFTGRVMPDRSWEFGLHQMIEAKEGVEITDRKVSLARITYQRFFRRYRCLSGMTGTIAEVANEIAAVYRLDTIRIPTNRASRRRDFGTHLFSRPADKWAAVVASAKDRIAVGQSVLIGTRSVEISEHICRLLQAAGLAHTLLNARQDRDEAEIIAAAGQSGRVTVATNMAGRGTDIRLSGEVADSGGLHVILTEFHESRRIDRQLFGRGGRQGDRGGYECFAALDDEILGRFGAAGLRRLGLLWAVGRPAIVPRKLSGLLIRSAQRTACRSSALVRRQTLLNDRALDTLLAFAGPRE